MTRGNTHTLLLVALVALMSIAYGSWSLLVQQESVSPTVRCHQYVDTPNLYGYCIYNSMDASASPLRVIEACFEAGNWEASCRHGWVAARLAERSPPEAALLLEVCGENDDCRLDVIDHQPVTDLLGHLNTCAEVVRSKGIDCAAHAAQTWWWSHPDTTEVERIGREVERYPELIGFYLGAASACGADIPCPENPQVQSFCEVTARGLRNQPAGCPPRRQ